jgi:ferritin
MSERDPERFDLDDDFLAEQQEDGNDYDRLLDRVDKRTRDKTKKVGKAAWSKLEEVLAERKLKRDLAEYDDYEG